MLCKNQIWIIARGWLKSSEESIPNLILRMMNKNLMLWLSTLLLGGNDCVEKEFKFKDVLRDNIF